MKLEDIVRYVTDKDISVHNKICNLYIKSGNKAEDFPKLPPCYFDVEITTKNNKKYKAILIDYKGNPIEYAVNSWRGRFYIPLEDVVKWEFI